MPGELSIAVKKRLRDMVYAAHEKALRQPLEDLGSHFDRWQRGEIDGIAFADLIRTFNDGPSREIYKRFTWSRNDDLPMLVAGAIHQGLLDESTIPEDVMAHVSRWLISIRSFGRNDS